MTLFLAGRFSLIVFTIAVIVYFSFAMTLWFPTDLVTALTGHTKPTAQEVILIEQSYNLSGTHWSQFIAYGKHLFSGEWGVSISTQTPVFQQIAERLPATLELVFYSVFISLFVGIPAGCLAGIKRHSKIDYTLLSFSLIGSSMPVFWIALIIVTLLSLQLGLFPTAGRLNVLYDVPLQTGFIFVDIYLSDVANKYLAYSNAIRHAALPTIALSLVTISMVLKITRRSTIDVMHSDYVKASLARGLSPISIVFRHGIKNIIFPIVPLLTLQFTVLLTNTMLIEMVFDWPGIGTSLLNALNQRDYPLIRGGLVVMATTVMLIIISVDIALRLFDPKKEKDIHGAI